MAKTCGFCGGPGQSQEHLWPDWIGKILVDARGEQDKRFLVEHERHGETTRFKTATFATTIGMPCRTCNNGWMSRLEETVKPFMSHMIFPGDKVFLDEARRRQIARWAVKTAMVFEFFRPDGLFYFTPEDRRAFINSTEPPNDVTVWLAKYDATRPLHASQDRKVLEETKDILFCCLTMTANFLAIQVAASRHLGAVRKVPVTEMPKDALIRIWPAPLATGELIQWPPPRTIGPTGLAVLDTRFRNLGKRSWSTEELEN